MTRSAVRPLGTRRDWRARLLVVTLIVLAVAIATPVAPAAAATTGELSGSVSSAVTGGALAGAYVDVYSLSSGGYVGFAATDHNGNYTVTGLAPGSYTVEFYADGYIEQYYNGQATLAAGDPVSVTAGQNTTGVDATMQVSGAISGHVTDAGTGGPAGGVQVVAYNSSNQVVAQTTADAGGAYTLTGLVTGSYDVEFEPVGSQPYLAQYYSGAATVSGATAVSVTDGQTSGGIDAAMSTGSGIEGTVTSGGQPAAGVDVTVFGSSGSAAGYGLTDAAGAYTVTGLTPGTYTVEFLPPTSWGVNAAPQYYDGRTTAASADPVTVAGGHFATVSADLPTGGQITGAVTDASTHAGLAGEVGVYAYSSSGGYSGYGYTDANGNYTISSLATGTYQVSFYPYDNSHVGSGQSGVSVTAGTVTSGINAALATGGTITGTLTDAIGGHAVGWVAVEAISSGGGSSGYEVSGSDGSYRIGGLSAGSYTVEFVPYTSANSAYTTQYYNGATSQSSATPVSVSLGQTTSGIDGTLSGGGSVSGTVDGGSSATPLSGVSVYLYSTSYQYYYGTATTDANGSFFFGGIPAGSYVAYFNSPNSGYGSEYYGGATNESSATSFAVTAGQATTGINQTLPAYGAVSGTVTDASTQAGVAGITVAALNSYGWQVASAITGTGGAYTVVGIPSGTYTVQFAPIGTGGDYLPTNRTGVSVTNGATTSAIDEALPAGGTVTGTVTDATSGTGLAGVTVTLYSLYQQYLTSTTTGAGGTYSLPGLPTGTYEVGFSYGSYVSTYYGGSQSLGSATQISVIAGQTTGSVSQALPRAGQIAGRVTDAVTGTAIANVQVQIYDSSGSVIASTLTGTTGGYSVTGVLPGTYTASFTPGDSTSTLMSQWYGGAITSAGATSFAVTADQTTRGIDASLGRGGIVSGTVTAATSGADLAGITVTVYNNGTSLGSTTTRQDGTYALGGIPTGSYTVGFALPAGGTVNYLPQYYDNAASASSATSVAVAAGQTTTGINAALQSGGQITGVVTDAATGKPVQNASVELLTGSYYFYASTLTDGNGDYTFSGLPSGSYQVAFSIGDGDYLAQNYNGQNSYRSYTNVTVAQGSTTAGIDAALDAPAEIQGSVTDSITGSPVSGVTVSTSGPNGTIQTTTGSDGTYSLTGLYPGSYTVYFQPPSGANYLSQYYNGAATSSGATPVSVGDGADVTGINASLQTGGQISGTVTSQATGTAISGLWVYVFDSSGNSAGSAQTGADGTYTVSNLPTGSYEVAFYGTGSYIPQYYNNQTSYANANPVAVTAGQATTGINAAMLSNGMISGTVTDHSTGNPIAGAYAYVYDSSGYYLTYAVTSSSGAYTTPGLPAGSYTVKFSATGYAPFTYSGTVSVSIGTTTSGINAALTADGAISGTVTNASGQTNLASVSVTAYDSSGSYVTSTSTATDGSYTLENMVPGTYELEFTPSSGPNYLPQYYHGESTLGSADPVTVTSGQTTTGIGAGLATGGQVTGKVTDSATGQPIQYAYAELLNASGGYVSYVSTAADGSFTLTALPTGTYTLYFSASGHLDQYYNNESSLSSADQISVTAGSTTSGINATLVPYGSIAGTVTDASTGHALQYVEVEAYDSSGQVVQGAYTSSTGVYTLSNLSPGTYALYFYDYYSATGYVAQYYNDQSTLAAADGITVNPGATTSAINAALVPEGAITGTVTDGNTHEAIPGVEVDVYDSTGTLVGSGTSSSTGQYTVGYLQPGTYRVGFYGQDSANQSVTQYYNQEATLAAADPVTVTAGATTSGINSQLDSVPTNLSAPTITGTAAQGSTLTEHNGSWTFNPTSYAYQWERCGQSTCAAIPGATAQTYEPTNADVGDTIEVQETATNLAGTSAAVTSTATAAVVGEPPANTTPPSISGTAQQGQTLTEVPGVWTNQPSTVQVQWLQCANGACSPITGATGSTYVPTANDVGDTIKVQEAASNDTGAGTPAVSSPTAAVLIPAPVNTAVPTISGTAQEGQTLTEANGTWSGGATSYTYQWERCDTSGANCQGIHGADASGYSPTAEDVGDTIEVWETAWNAGGASKVAMSAPTAPVTLPPLAADAGEAATGSVGVPVTLDGSGSIPASAITGYHWDFGDGTSGDGESVRHTYSATGKFTATLTVSEGSSTATSTVLVTVGPHASGVTIAIQDPNGQPLAGADVVYMAPDGSRINATADGNGVATLTGMPDGADNVYAWAQGYQVATGTVTVSGGTGSGTVNLVPGQVASATLTSTQLTLSQIQALGIDTSDPGNQNVYQFQAALKFPPSYGGGGGGGGGSPDLCGYVNGNGQFVGSTGTCGGGGGGATCTNAMCFGPGWTAVPIMVNGEPMIEWLTIAGQVSVLKQFFAVDMVIQNLAGSPVELDNGSATLNLPDGLSLAPTATPQSATQSVGTIAAGQSAAVEWIVRGDTPGSYYFSADYHGTLQPFNQPITISAGLHDPLVVYGADALKLSVQADSGSMVVGQPYHVRLAITNTAPVPFYNVGLSTPDQATNFIFQPLQTFSSSVSTLNPGQTLYSPWFILVPALPSAGNFDPSGSYASFVGQRITPGTGITAVTPPTLYTMTAPREDPALVHLHWQQAPGAEGYEVFSTPTLDTAFAEAPDSVLTSPTSKSPVTVLPASATDAYITGTSAESPRFYAVTTIIGGHPTLDHPVLKPELGPFGGPPSSRELAAGGHNPSEFCLRCFMGKLMAFVLPVDAPTGNFWHSFTDLNIPGRGVGLDLTRTYNSVDAGTDGPFGYGWSFPYGMSLTFPDATHVVVSQENGTQVTFTEQAGGIYTAPPRVTATLVHDKDGTWTFVRRARETFAFNSGGRLTREEDLNGNVTSLAYNAQGELESVTDPAGRKLTFTSTGSHISSVTDPLGRVVRYSYDQTGDLTDVTDVGGGDTHFTYDGAHRMLTMRLPAQAPGVPGSTGATIGNVYDGQGRVTEQTDQLGRTTKFSYSGEPLGEAGGTTTITNPKGNVTVQSYQFGELLSETKGHGTPQAATWKFGYDQATLGMATITDPNGHTTTNTFDSEGNLLTSTNALGHTTTNTYDLRNDLLTSTDPMGVTATMTYDSRGNPLSSSRPLAGTSEIQKTTYTYGDTSHPGDVTAMTDPDGKTWKYSYDAYGDRASATDPVGNKTTSAYNTIGWLTSTTSPRGNVAGANPASFTTTYAHNSFGQVTETVDPLGHKTTDEYGPDQNLVASTDADGNLTRYSYDAADERTATHRADGTTLQTTYWPDGTVKEQIDGAGHATHYEYDSLGRVVAVTDPLGRVTHHAYDPAGNETSMTDPEGQVTTRNYDAGNQLTSVAYSDGKTPNVTGITYDADGERTGMTDATGAWTWRWDSLHRLASAIEGANGTVGYQYDLDSHPTAITYPNGKTVARGYDAAGHLTGVTDWLGHTTTFSYDASSNLSEEQYPSGVTTQLNHDNADRLIAMSDAGGGHTLASFNYTRDAIEQVSSETANNGEPSTINYTYDTLNQLTAANKAPYGYDAADNPTTFGANTTQSFDTANQLTSRTEASEVAEGPKEEGTTKEKEGQKAPEGSPPSGAGAGSQGTTTTTTGGGVEGTQVSYKPPTKNATVSATIKRGGKLTSPKLHIGGSHDLLVAFISASGPRSGTQRVTKLSGGGLRWSLVARNAGAGGVAEIWQAQASHAVNGHVTAQLRASGYPATLTIAAFSGSPYIVGHTTSSGHASTPAITLRDASGALIVAVGHSGGQKAAIAPLAGQQLLAKYFDKSSHSAGWVQQTQASSTSARIADATPAAQWEMVAVAIASHPARAARIARVGKAPSTVGPAVHAAPAAATTAPSASGVISATSVSGSASIESVVHHYTYNARGNRTGESAGSTTLTLSYDQANRLIGVGNAIAYAYNGDGLRMSKTVSGVTTHFVWSEAESPPELLQDGAISYIYGPEGTPIEQISGNTPAYLHQDQQGSTRLLTDGEGNVVGRYNYDAWGNVTSHTGSAATNLQYDGQYTDAETGYQYLRARFYDPKTGQFLTRDPATGVTLATYGFAAGDPLMFQDPRGLFSWSHFVKVTAIVVGVVGLGAAVCVATVGLGCPAAIGVGAGTLTAVATGATVVGYGLDVASTAIDCGGGKSGSAACHEDEGGIALDVATGGRGYLIHSVAGDTYDLVTRALGLSYNLATSGGTDNPQGTDGSQGGQPCSTPLSSSNDATRYLQPATNGNSLQ